MVTAIAGVERRREKTRSYVSAVGDGALKRRGRLLGSPFAIEPLFSDGIPGRTTVVGRPALVVRRRPVGARVARRRRSPGARHRRRRPSRLCRSRAPSLRRSRRHRAKFHDSALHARSNRLTPYVVESPRAVTSHDAVIAAQGGTPGRFAYVGMLGTRRKAALTREQLREWDVSEERRVRAIHAPVGVSIGAGYAREIRVSHRGRDDAVRRGVVDSPRLVPSAAYPGARNDAPAKLGDSRGSNTPSRT